MGDINALLEKAAGIANDSIPVGSGGGESQRIVLAIFEANSQKYFTGKQLKEFFANEGVEIKAVSNILHKLAKDGKLEKPKTGVYRLKQN